MPDSVRHAFPDRPDIAGDPIPWLATERREWLDGRYVSCPWDMKVFMDRKDETVKYDKLKTKMILFLIPFVRLALYPD